MGFNWGGAASGALEGSAFGPWGVLAGGAIGGFMSGSVDSSAQAAADTNRQMIDFARENRSWSEMMANTVHQREVKDLVAAGLSPVLSATHGGAPTGMTSLPQLMNPQANSPAQLAQFGQLAVASAQSLAQMGLVKEQAKTEMTQQGLNVANSARTDADRQRILQETRLLTRDADAETSPFGKAMKYVSMFTDAFGKMFHVNASGSLTSAKGRGSLTINNVIPDKRR